VGGSAGWWRLPRLCVSLQSLPKLVAPALLLARLAAVETELFEQL
jgi:hypothetical protein